MSRWTCPACDREFGRARQAHVCVPGGTVEESFAGRPPAQRATYLAIYRALVDHLRTLGPVHADTVRVGVFLKRSRTLAEVRPMARALSVDLVLPRRVEDPRILRVVPIGADRIVHVVRLTELEQVDGQLLGWLTEAYVAAG